MIPMPVTPTSPSAAEPSWEGSQPGTAAYRRISLAVFLAGAATFAILYTTQPLLPLLAREFGISAAQSALSVSLSTIGLGAALLVAGPLSEVVGRTPMMHVSLIGSSLICCLVATAPTWPWFLGLRLLLGVVLAGLPAVTMAYVTEELSSAAATRTAGLYVAGTAFGGMAGRLASGVLADVWNWQAAQVGVGILGLACGAAVLPLLPPSRRFVAAPASVRHLARTTGRILRDPTLLMLFGISFTAMGAMVGVYNTIGFRLEAPPYALSIGLASLVFLVYLVGSAGSTVTGRLSARFGRRPVAPLAALVMLTGILLTLAAPLPVLILALALQTGGFFALHGVASGWVPVRARLGPGGAAQASSVYLFAYYLGSSVFGTLAGSAWQRAGWEPVVALCAGLVVASLGLTLLLRRTPSLEPAAGRGQ